MDMKRLLLLHVEKLVVAVVVIYCVWSVYGTMTNEETITTADEAEIKKIFNDLQNAQANPGRPNFHKVRDFKAELLGRLDNLQVSSEPTISYLWEHPDIGPGEPELEPGKPYVYELGVPKVEVVDRVGVFDLSVTLPSAMREVGPLDLVKDDPNGVEWNWQVPIPGGGFDVRKNSARMQGLLVEMATGKPENWRPLVTPESPNGYVALSSWQPFLSLRLEGVQEGLKYYFRARAIAKATAPADWGFTQGREVLVVSPALSAKQFPKDEAAANELQTAAKDGKLVNRAERMENPIGSSQLSPLEQQYAGAWSDAAGITSKSSVRVALLRVTKFGEDPAVARVLVMKKVKNQEGTLVWTESKEYTVKEGEKIGKKDEKVKRQGEDKYILADLRTPYVFKRYEDVKRDTFFVIKRKSSFQNGQPQGKKLVVEPKTRNSQVAFFLNTVTDEEEAYLRLETRAIRPPKGNDPLYPLRSTFAQAEVQGFKADPGAFDYPEAKLTAPELVDDVQVLRRLGVDQALMSAIEKPFVVVPDGRVYAWDGANSYLMDLVIPGSAYDRAQRNAPPPQVDEPVDEADESLEEPPAE